MKTWDRGGRRCGAVVLGWLVFAGGAVAEVRRVFATSLAGSGNLSTWSVGSGTGLARADSICETLANNAGVPHSAPFRAWLSTDQTDAFCHLFGYSGQRTGDCSGQLGAGEDLGPWVLVNGVTSWSGSLRAIVSESALLQPALFNENNVLTGSIFPSAVWTGTGADGRYSGAGCVNFTSGAANASGTWGTAVATSELFTSYNDIGDCSGARRLLCLEAGVGNPAPSPYWFPGRVVFTSSADGAGNLLAWPEAAGAAGPGLDAGDQICQSLAASAHLPAPDSFVAWLSTSALDAVDRIPSSGPYRRLDGFVVANSRADLVDGDNDAPLNQDETGSRAYSGAGVWTGTAVNGTAGDTCSNWTSGTDGSSGMAGYSSVGHSSEWTALFSNGCSLQHHLYCISTVLTIFWDGFEMSGDATRWSNVVP